MLIAQCQIRFVEPDGFSLISVILRRADDSADAVVGSVGAGTDNCAFQGQEHCCSVLQFRFPVSVGYRVVIADLVEGCQAESVFDGAGQIHFPVGFRDEVFNLQPAGFLRIHPDDLQISLILLAGFLFQLLSDDDYLRLV